MTNNSTECTPGAGKRKRPDETLEKELGVCWGLTKGESTQKGWTTRKGIQTQQIPGGLEPAQEEQEVQPDEGLDQLAGASGDRSEKGGLDQSEETDDDRLSEHEGV